MRGVIQLRPALLTLGFFAFMACLLAFPWLRSVCSIVMAVVLVYAVAHVLVGDV